jgi:hypothetical protein
MMTATEITRVTVFCSKSAWCYAAWVGRDHDHNDTLPDAATEAEARRELAVMFPGAEISRVNDDA